MIWGTGRTSGEQEVEARPPAAGNEVLPEVVGFEDLRHRDTVALFGMTDSGKTSFLYALKHAPANPARLRWSWPSASRPLASATSAAGEALRGTRPGVFFVRELGTLRRAWFPGTGGSVRFIACPTRKVSLPEIAGEHVENFAAGAEASDERTRQINERIEALLAESDELLFLVGVKESQSKRQPTQDSVEREISRAASALGVYVGYMRSPEVRDKRHPVFLTLLITKRDALRAAGGLGIVRVRAADSMVASLAASRGGDLAKLVGRAGADDVEFNLNDLCDHREADLPMQEAAAWDFLRCHAPRAATMLSGIGRQPGVSLRVLTCKPFGVECRTSDGAAALPLPSQIDSSMVWESLDDVVERSYRWRMRRALQRASVALAAAMVLLAALPALDMYVRSRADTLIAELRHDEARAELDGWMFRYNPWTLAAHALSDRLRFEDADRWHRLRESMKSKGADDRMLDEVDRRILELDPSGVLVDSDMDRRARERLEAFILGTIDSVGKERLLDDVRQPNGLQVSGDAIERGINAADRGLRRRPLAASKDSPEEWTSVAERAEEIRAWLGNVGGGGASLIARDADLAAVDALRGRLESIASLARVRADVALLGEGVGGDRVNPEWAGKRRGLIARAVTVDDQVSIAKVDVIWRAEVGRWWSEADTPGAGDPEGIVGRLANADAWQWPAAAAHCRPLACQSFRTWLEGKAADLEKADGDGFAQSLESLAGGIERGSNALADWGITDPGKLVGSLRRLGKLVRDLGDEPSSVSPESIQAPDTLTAAFPKGGPPEVKIILASPWERVVGKACVSLGRRLDELAPKLVEGGTSPKEEADRLLKVAGKLSCPGHVRRTAEIAAATAFERMLAGRPDPSPSGDGSALCECLRASGQDGTAMPAILGAAIGRGLTSEQAAGVLGSMADCAGVNVDASIAEQLGKVAFASDEAAGEVHQRAAKDMERLRASPDGLLRDRGSELLKAAAERRQGGDEAGARAKLDLAVKLRTRRGVGLADRMAAGLASGMVDKMDRGLDVGPELEVLRIFASMLDQADGSAVRAAIQALDSHAKVRSDWGLRPVLDPEGNVVVFMAPEEFSIGDLRKLAQMEPGKVIEIVGAQFEPGPDGQGLRPKPGTPGAQCDRPGRQARLGLSADQSERLAELAGARLPAAAEWNAARGRVKEDASQVEQSLAGDRNTIPQRGTAAELRKVGDVSADGIVGLLFGMREWCSGQAAPLGRSNDSLERAYKEDIMADVGFRMALDPVPAPLRRLAGPDR